MKKRHRLFLALSLALFALLPVAAGAAWIWQANAATGSSANWLDYASQFGVPFLILAAVALAIRAVWVWFKTTAWPEARQSLDNGFKGLGEELKLHRSDQASQHGEQLTALRDLFSEIRLIKENRP